MDFFLTYILMYSVPESGHLADQHSDIYPEVEDVYPFLLQSKSYHLDMSI